MKREIVLYKKIWIYPNMSLPDSLFWQCEHASGIFGEDFLNKFKKSKALVITMADRQLSPWEFEHWDDSICEPIKPLPKNNPLSPAFKNWTNFQVRLTKIKSCYFEN